jgi:hypothetical protein
MDEVELAVAVHDQAHAVPNCLAHCLDPLHVHRYVLPPISSDDLILQGVVSFLRQAGGCPTNSSRV